MNIRMPLFVSGIMFSLGMCCAQPASVVLWETTECLGCPCGDPTGTPDGTMLYLMWDQNSSGPDPGDSVVGAGSYDCDDTFPCFCGTGPITVWDVHTPNSYWAMVSAESCCWSSVTFSLISGPMEVELDGWSCMNEPCFTAPWVHITLSFDGCMQNIGCPCAYPEFYPEGSQVQLMRALPPPGPMGDELVSLFETSRGAGLPPWDCNWTPVPGELPQGTYYVFSYSDPWYGCCWVTDHFPVTDNTPIFITEAMWHCLDAPCLPVTSPPLASTNVDSPPPLRVAPNPFNPATYIEFELAASSHVNVAVFDVTGREAAQLADATMPAGTHRFHFDGAARPSGIYFATLTTPFAHTTIKLLLLK